MAAGERIDWGGDNWAQSKRLAKSSFSGLLSRDRSPRGAKNNNKYTGFTVKNGGSASQKTAAGTSGLHKTLVDRKLNLQKGEKIYPESAKIVGMNVRKNQWVARGGGTPSKAIVQSKPSSVKVRPAKG